MKNRNRKVEQRGESGFLVLLLDFSFCCFLANQVTNLEPQVKMFFKRKKVYLLKKRIQLYLNLEYRSSSFYAFLENKKGKAKKSYLKIQIQY